MRAADVHGFKHSSIFGWQKGCCCWKLELTRAKSLAERLNKYRACPATWGQVVDTDSVAPVRLDLTFGCVWAAQP
jgi:hypothetical protein